jgi:hypothetical protein
MVYPPPLNNRALVTCTFDDATRTKAAEKRNIFMDFILSLCFADDSPAPIFSNIPGERAEIRLTSARL